jgi:hypothetical protein
MVSTSADVLETHDIGEYSRVRSTGRGCRRGYLFLYEAGLISQLHGIRKPHSGPLSEERIQECNSSNCVEFRAMHERIRLINHLGKKILLVDLSNCPVNQVEEVVRKVPDYITVQPLRSVLVLTHFTGATFDRDAIRAIKETAVFDKPFVKKSALLGIEGMSASFYEELKSFSRRDMTIFKTRDAALGWLTADSVDVEPTSQFWRAYDTRKQGDNRCDAQESKNKIENASMVVATNRFILSEP